ncbi:hypothetical protein Trydic_g22597 [Trypoxylus dichotomus]
MRYHQRRRGNSYAPYEKSTTWLSPYSISPSDRQYRHTSFANGISLQAEIELKENPNIRFIAPKANNYGPAARTWIKDFFNDILNTGCLLKEFKMSQTLALRGGSLPCICYKLLEWIIYNRIYRTINKHLPYEQAVFRPSRSWCEQVLAVTSHIELRFQ